MTASCRRSLTGSLALLAAAGALNCVGGFAIGIGIAHESNQAVRDPDTVPPPAPVEPPPAADAAPAPGTLERDPASPDPDVSGRVSRDAEEAGGRLLVEVADLDPGRPVEFLLERADGSLDPAAAASADEAGRVAAAIVPAIWGAPGEVLAGRRIEVRTAEGMPLLSGRTP
jgi:hypothetical protein